MQNYLTQLAQRKIAVIGFGLTGLASAEFLCRQGLPFTWVDSREDPKALPQVNELCQQHQQKIDLVWGSEWKRALQKAEFVIASPGVPLVDIEQICPQAEITSDIAVFMNCVQKPVIAITGSNGKSTVTQLAAHLLNCAGIKAQLGGNIGIPALNLVEESFDVAVLELSSFQLEITPPQAYRSAVFLNVSEDHMDRYDSFDAYISAKQRIFPRAELAVFSLSDLNTTPVTLASGAERKAFCFDVMSEKPSGTVDEVAYCDGECLKVNEQVICSVADLHIAGQHNIANALAAILLVSPWQLSPEILRQGLESFEGLSHRCQVVRSNDGIRWINDSKATNVGATVAALKGLKGSTEKALHLLLGGEGKAADFSAITQPVLEFASSVICYGKDGSIIEPNITNSDVQRVNTFNDALALARQKAVAGDTVLLSPACASFDEFTGFEARGQAFVEFVQREEKQ